MPVNVSRNMNQTHAHIYLVHRYTIPIKRCMHVMQTHMYITWIHVCMQCILHGFMSALLHTYIHTYICIHYNVYILYSNITWKNLIGIKFTSFYLKHTKLAEATAVNRMASITMKAGNATSNVNHPRAADSSPAARAAPQYTTDTINHDTALQRG